MAKPKAPELPPDAWDTAFEPYARAIGYMLREWNDLQERFATLFTTLVNDDNPGVARAVWYAIKNDRSQREMICEAAAFLFPTGEDVPHVTRRENSRIIKAINYAKIQADLLGYDRDAATHAPVALLVGDPAEFIARDYFKNPLAMKLRGKKLLAEYTHYRARAEAIRRYVSAINFYLRSDEPRVPFPKKPAQPIHPDQIAKAGRPHKDRQ